MTRLLGWAGVALALLLAASAHAGDGVIEINAASAAAGGVTPGDTPSLPVTLTLPGSYRLTGNLTTTDPNQDVIRVAADHVTLDLGGHTISGPASCAAFPCTNTGGGRAIATVAPNPLTDPTADNLRITNGVVRGMGGFGIEVVGDSCQIDGLLVSDNGGNGIQAFCVGQVLRTISRRNGDNGIHLVHGIVADSQAIGNATTGIYISGSALVIRNNATSNGALGVFSGGDSSLLGNTLIGNTGGGFQVSANTGYGQNVISGNGAPQTTGGSQMGGNVCNAGPC
jgi:hypothetical protein